VSPATADLQVRKNASTLTELEKQDFVEAVLALKKITAPDSTLNIYDTFVLRHLESFAGGHAHEGPAFLPWHRQFLLEFERELRKVNPNVTVPYWDFTVDNSPTSPIWSSDFLGGDGNRDNKSIVEDGPFAQGKWILPVDGTDLRRQFGLFAETLPTLKEVEAGLAIMIYDSLPFDLGSSVEESFRNYVEGFNHLSGEAEMHNRVHLWLGGSSTIDVSPNDPIFWLLHANFDRIWAEWEALYGLNYLPLSGARPGHNLHDTMFPFDVAPADVLDHRALGYIYDTELAGNLVPEPSSLGLGMLGALALFVVAWRRRSKRVFVDEVDCQSRAAR
jgi:tyrosinase